MVLSPCDCECNAQCTTPVRWCQGHLTCKGRTSTCKCIKLRTLSHTQSTRAVKDYKLHDASVVNLVVGPDSSNPCSVKIGRVQQPLLGLIDIECMRRSRAKLHLGLGL